ncbi:MAG: polysaccharide pyruvyl transferase family protein [Lachnospirales bacterium]
MKIFVYAFFARNLGDDLFIKILCERFHEIEFYAVLSRKNAIPFYGIKNFHPIYSENKKEEIIDECDAILKIGGSVFIQPQENYIEYCNSELKIIQGYTKKNKPFFVIGANFGPFYIEEFKEQFQKFFKYTKDTCFRDSYSYNLFSNLDNVRVAPDVIFGLNDKILKKRGKYIVFSCLDYRKEWSDFFSSDEYYRKIASVIKYYTEQNYKVYMISFCHPMKDWIATLKATKYLNIKSLYRVRLIFYNGNIKNVLSIIKGASYIIGTRFHAIVLGLLYNIPVFPIVYSNKHKNLLNDINYIESGGRYIDITDFCCTSLDDFNANLENSIIPNIEYMKKNAYKQFDGLKTFINEKTKRY